MITYAKLTATFKDGISIQESWDSLTKTFRGSSMTLIMGNKGGSFHPVDSNYGMRGGALFENRDRRLELNHWKPPHLLSYNEVFLKGGFVKANTKIRINKEGESLILDVDRWETRVGWGKILTGATAFKTLSLGISGQNYAEGWNDLPIENAKVRKGKLLNDKWELE